MSAVTQPSASGRVAWSGSSAMASSHSSHRVTAGCWRLYALAALALWYGSRCRSQAKPHGLRPSWSARAFYVTVRLGVTTG